MSKPILVVGATGTVGKPVVDMLVEKDARVRVLVHTPRKKQMFENMKVSVYFGDVDHLETLVEPLNGVEKLFIALPSSENQEEREINLINAAIRSGVEHIVKISIMGATLDSLISIARKHYLIEERLWGSGINYTILRPNYYMQNFLKDAETIRNKNQITTAIGSAEISMIDARDVAKVAVESLLNPSHEKQTYLLTGTEAITFKDAADVFTDLFDRHVELKNVSPEEYRKRMLGAGYPLWYANDVMHIAREFNDGVGEVVSPRFEIIMGEKPRTFRDFVKDYIEEFQLIYVY